MIQAEDVYISFGLPPMTKQFWKNSIFEKHDNLSLCHGSAANMYSVNDYRYDFKKKAEAFEESCSWDS